MVNEEHSARLKKGVQAWNEWRLNNPNIIPELSGDDLSNIDLNGANLSEVNFSGVNLSETDFSMANLSGADLSKAKLSGFSLFSFNDGEEDFYEENFSRAILSKANLSGANLSGLDLSGFDLSEANLRGTNLSGANLSGLDLSGFDLSGANLSRANLSRTQALGTDFTGAEFTGACLEDWNINSATKLNDINCQYVYLKSDFQERRPSSGEFRSGEFTKLFQKVIETVDLIFADGIDWKAFFQSFQELRRQYDDENLSIQAIEKKSGGAFVIRLEVSAEADKVAIESHAKELYKTNLLLVEERYRVELNAKEREIEIYKQQSAKIEKIVELLSSREEPKVSLHPYQIKILKAINNGADTCSNISEVLNIQVHIVKYYIETLESESYLQCTKWNDGISPDNQYMCRLTNKGRVALQNPDLLLPSARDAFNQTINNDLRGANISNFANKIEDTARQVASDLSQNIDKNINEINT
nr:pentapeptide repeat-containing protein [Nostoc sp. ChiQUE02]MDZ8234545.1 pentapeptide repeat-containing protein [Nostoc sp. ChiQUE02]